MSKTLLVVLKVEVEDLSDETRKSIQEGADGAYDDMPGLADTSATEAAAPLEGVGTDISDDLFAGCDTFVRYVNAEIVTALWVEDEPK